ncbi:MAG TPA: hypothetical protein VN761_11610 [Candidatus Polarisedimenticolia bacterium]|nr:hypothetical protein [Candidatus Polarisedimenticolia bacterium]
MNPPPIPPPHDNRNSIAHQAAKASFIAPVLVILLAMAHASLAQQFHNPAQVGLIFDLVGLVLIVAGFVAAIVGLAGIPTYGKAGLLGRSIAGLVINGFLIFIFGTNFVSAQKKALASRQALKEIQASSADIRSDLKKNFDPKNGITNVDVDKIGRISSQLRNASQNLSGDDAKVANVMAAFLDRTRGALKTFQDSVAEMRNARVLDRFDPNDKGQFAARKKIVQRFLQANSDLTKTITNAEDSIRADLVKAQLSQPTIESVIAGYHSSTAPMNATTLQIRQCDDRMGHAMLDALNTLESQWGHWKVDPGTGRLAFDDLETRETYNKSIIAMKTAANDEVKLQAELIDRQQRAQR